MKFLLKLKTDSNNAIVIIYFFLIAATGVCFLFEKRFPNLRFISNLSSITFIVLSLLSLFIVLFYKIKSDLFNNKFNIIHCFFETNIEVEKKPASLFALTFQHVYLFLVGLILTIGSIWLVFWLNCYGAAIALGIELLVSVYYLKNKKSQLKLIGVLILVGLPLLLLIQKEYYLSSVGSGLITGAIIGSLIFSIIQRNIKKEELENTLHGTLTNLISRSNTLFNKAHETIYNKSNTYNFQALLISVILLSYFAGPTILKTLPPNLQSNIVILKKFIGQYKNFIPYIVCLVYCLLSFAPVINYIIKPFLFKKENNIFKLAYNLFVGSFFVMFFGPFIFLPVAMIIICLFLLGEYIFGTDFALIVGFFVFPDWSSRFYTAIVVIVLFLTPNKLVSRSMD